MKMKPQFVILSVLISFLIPLPIFADNEILPSGKGSAGAYIARAEDNSALFYNPAGLSRLGKGEITFSIDPLFQKSFYTNVGKSTWKTEAVEEFHPTLIVSGKYNKLGFAIGSATIRDQQFMWKSDDFPGRYLSTGSMLKIQSHTAGLSFSMTDKISFGAAFRMAEIEYDLFRKIPDIAVDEFGQRIAYETENALNFSGDSTGYLLGVQYYKHRRFSMGLTYQSSVEVGLAGDEAFILSETDRVPLVMNTHDTRFIPQLVESTFTIPSKITIGFCTKITVRTRLETNISWETFSDVNTTTINPQDENSGTQSRIIPRNWDDRLAIKFGADFLHRKNLLWRIGISSTESIVPDDTLEPSFPDSDHFLYGFGVSYTYEKYKFEAAYTYTQYRDRKSQSQEYIHSWDNPDQTIIPTYQTGLFETQKHDFSLGIKRIF